MSDGLVLGVDGGGSKTIALLSDGAGRPLGSGVAGPSNYQAIGAEAAYEAILLALARAFLAAGLDPVAPERICLGLAGAGRPVDAAIFRDWAQRIWPEAAITVVSDVDLVLAAGTPDGWGLALICGTGSIAYGRNQRGQTARAGGWGYLLGDEGSGYAIGLAALRAVARAADGRAPQTALTAAVLEHWSLAHPQALIQRVYRGQTTQTDIALLAQLVHTAATQQDAVACQILDSAGQALALALQAVTQQLGTTGALPCAIAGGFILNCPPLVTATQAAAAQLGLQISPYTLVDEPVHGAISLAARV